MKSLKLFQPIACVLVFASATFAQQEPALQHRTVSERPATRPSAEPLGIALENYDYPYPVKFLEMKAGEETVRMGYMDVGARGTGNGKNVVLLHGKNFGGYYWKDTIDAFAEQGYRVIVPDQVGWGKSSKPDMHYTFDDMAKNTAVLLDNLKVDKAILIGHSMGGMLAVKFASAQPARVERVLLESPIGMEDYSKHFGNQTVETFYAAELKPADEATIRDQMAGYFADAKSSKVDPLAEIPIRVRLSGEYPRWAKAKAQQSHMIHEQPVRESYRSLGMPVYIIVGDKDKTVPGGEYVPAEQRQGLGNYPKLATDAAAQIPQGKAEVMKDTGHIPHVEKPAEFNAKALNFAKGGGPTMTVTE
jgi:pimeloyl-ACP methyl ester carboxylesterase